MASDLSESTAPQKRWHEKAWKNLRKLWVQVAVIAIATVICSCISWVAFSPNADRTADKKAGKFKFMHCDQCHTELAYNPELDGKRCPKCQPPKTGFFTATEGSIKGGASAISPYKWAYLSVALESIFSLGVIVYLLHLPYVDPNSIFYAFLCPHCGQRLRFRKVSLGGLGHCSRCKRPIRFPDEDSAALQADPMHNDG